MAEFTSLFCCSLQERLQHPGGAAITCISQVLLDDTEPIPAQTGTIEGGEMMVYTTTETSRFPFQGCTGSHRSSGSGGTDAVPGTWSHYRHVQRYLVPTRCGILLQLKL